MPRQQRWALLFVTAAILAMAVMIGLDDARDGIVAGVLGALVMLALLLWTGRRGRHTPWARAATRIAPGHAVVLWKPGCAFCEKLLLQLRSDDRVTWVNVWRDEEANAQLRAVNGGDELTPTVLLGAEVLRNPSAAELRARLSTAGPTSAGPTGVGPTGVTENG